MYSFPQFTRSTLWGGICMCGGQLFSREILLWWCLFLGGNFSRKQFSRGNYPGAIVLEPLILQQPNFPLSALCNFVMV